MKLLTVYVVTLLVTFSCSNKISPDNSTLPTATASTNPNSVIIENAIPVCIQQKIDSIKSQPVGNPPAEIQEYKYNNKRVFVISAPCCDRFNTAYDDNCNYFCAPSGGFTGKGDGKCTDFFKVGKHDRLVWKDDRKRQ